MSKTGSEQGGPSPLNLDEVVARAKAQRETWPEWKKKAVAAIVKPPWFHAVTLYADEWYGP